MRDVTLIATLGARLMGIVLAAAGSLGAGAAASDYAPGFVWDRSKDWTPGRAQGFGYQFGNPAPDQNGGAAWAYEYLFRKDFPDQPWYRNAPRPLVWDADWFGIGLEVWDLENDTSPLVSSTTITHVVSTGEEFADAPVVRWMNPTVANCTVRITGDLTLHWTGNQKLATPVDISTAIVLVSADRQFTELYHEVHADPSPGDQNIGVKKVPIDLAGVKVPVGGSIMICVRGDQQVPGRWCDMDDNLKITLKEIDGGCTPDIDGNGVLDLFDFLEFVNLFNAGC